MPNGPDVLVVDAANVIGCRPAAARAGALADDVVVVLEGQSRRGVDEGMADRVEVVHAPGEGDDTIVEVAAARLVNKTALAAGVAYDYRTNL